MKTMTIENAVEYGLNEKVVIHTPTQEAYNRLEMYFREQDRDWLSCNRFPEYDGGTCVDVSANVVRYGDIDWCHDNGYEVIEIESASADKSNTIEKGDTVEILYDTDPDLKDSIGLQGVVMWGSNNFHDLRVKLPIDIMGDNIWIYSIEALKLIHKASKTPLTSR